MLKYYKKHYVLFTILLIVVKLLNAQITISGFVKDANNGELLIGAYVQDTVTGNVASTNVNGYFSVLVNQKSNLIFSYVGYAKQASVLCVTKDTILNISLIAGKNIDEVVVQVVKRQQFNVARLSIKELESIPSITGKPDVMKAMHLLPGIQNQSEGSSLLIVRGGDPGQNLYLLDNTPLIYVNHLGGFMSVFNPEMMNSISLTKGGFPAEYGGKLSSIVKVTQRSGNNSACKGTFGIGLTDINASIEGPIGKKASYIITGRKTLFDILLYGVTKISDGNSNVMIYGFYDINGKLTLQVNKKNRLSFNFFQGDDYINNQSKGGGDYSSGINTKGTYIWGNWLASANWYTVLSAKLFSETTFSYTRYRLKQKQEISGLSAPNFNDKFLSSVDDISVRNKWDYKFKSWWNLNFGFNSSMLIHTPYSYKSNADNGMENTTLKVDSYQNAIFVSNIFKPTKTLSLIAGIRAVSYKNIDISDYYIEPRLSFNYSFTSNIDANVSYMEVKQYSHLLFTAGNITSNEVWIPATHDIKPAKSEQISAGLITNFLNNQWHIELSAYCKTLSNLSTYKEGIINLKGSADWVSKIETGGKGLSYGLEFFAKRNYGNWKGSLAYTYSKTTREYQGINNGNIYNFEFDRPHNISLLLNRKLSEKWDFSLVWTFQTGLPYTPVIGRQYTPSVQPSQNDRFYYEALIYGEHNSERLANYHRLDIGFNYHKKSKRGNRVVWNFSIYNLYNRQNPNYYYYNAYDGGDEHHPELGSEFKPVNKYQMGLFPILPAFSYKVYFDGKNKGKSFIKDRLKGFLYFNSLTPKLSD